eukprot:3490543-Pyramimonas_sp.AAC.1
MENVERAFGLVLADSTRCGHGNNGCGHNYSWCGHGLPQSTQGGFAPCHAPVCWFPTKRPALSPWVMSWLQHPWYYATGAWPPLSDPLRSVAHAPKEFLKARDPLV